MSFTSADPVTGTDALGETVTVAGAITKYRAGMLMHKDAMALAEQQSIRSQSQYKLEYLGTLVSSDTVYGVKELRDYAALAVIFPA